MSIDLLIVTATFSFVIWLYFKRNPMRHSKAFMFRRFVNWFPLGMTYSFLYMARYNLTVSKNALGPLMSISDFGTIFGFGTLTYGLSFLLNGPLVDKIGGKRGILIAALGSSVANVLMGTVTYLYVQGKLQLPMVATFSVLYSLNMFFQSYGAVSIIKVKAYWFHVRERGIFGSIFGTLLGFGVYFALDWGQAIVNASTATLTAEPTRLQSIFRYLFAIETGGKDAVWLVFFIPAFILILWAIIDLFLIKDTPGEANFADFDVHDASSDEADEPIVISVVLKKILTNPIMLTIAAIEFTGGVLRNGVVNWYFIFAKAVPQVGAEFFKAHWGLLLAVTGSIGGLVVGWVSDHHFHSRRGPPAAICLALIFGLTVIMTGVLMTSPITVAVCAIAIAFLVISVHSLMSGTAAADFGGKKMTATASGITDGFVYLGSALQSFAIGYLSEKSWSYWPMFLIPFPVIGFFLAWKMWHSMPNATRKYLASVENVHIKVVDNKRTISLDAEVVTVTES
jgi:OPA family glycerol-3-phosphate transporter-like MFS transporter